MTTEADNSQISVSALVLTCAKGDRDVTVVPEDEDRFVIKLSRAIKVLQLAGSMDAFREQFNLLLKVLGEWVYDRKDRSEVRDAYVTLRDGALAFVVVQESVSYDDRLHDALTDLDIFIARDVDLNLIELHAMLLPPASEGGIGTFLDSNFTLKLTHGENC